MIKYLSFVCLFFINTILVGQSLSSLSNVDFKNLSEAQLELIISQAKASGYSENQLLALAKQQGLSLSEIQNLSGRISSIKSKRVANSSASPVSDSRLRAAYADSMDIVRTKESNIFGLDLFKGNSFLTFQPNMDMTIPEDYVIGPGDEVFIDIYGTSESYYQAEVGPNGKIILENIGPIALGGLTLSGAAKRLRSKLSILYKDLNAEEGSTLLEVTLGDLRSIKVNVLGQVELPGTYTLSALSTVFNALYASGGISENGTLRAVRVYRNNKMISEIDLYEFLLRGDSSKNIKLKDDDVIIVSPFSNRIKLMGAVKTPAFFEVTGDETIKDLLFFSGGFAPNADNRLVNISRVINGERIIADVSYDQFEIFTLLPGDEIKVREVVNNYANRVIIDGAVYNSGQYELVPANALKDLIINSVGLRPDALLDKAIIKRTKPDFSTELISFNLSEVLEGSKQIELMREDVITILSKRGLLEENYVSVNGEVNIPGVIPYSVSITLNDIILLSGGLRESGYNGRVEVARRKSSDDSNEESLADIAVYELSNDKLLNDVKLEPFDQVFFRRNPNYEVQSEMRVEGEVKYPGTYVIQGQNERISDILKRSGGINAFAFVEGATLLRKTEFAESIDDINKQKQDLEALQARLSLSEVLTQEEALLLERIEANIERLTIETESNTAYSTFTKRERLKEIMNRNDLMDNENIKTSESIGIDLMEVLDSPRSRSDLLIEDGDVLIIPKRDETIRLRGKLLYPTTVRFEQTKGLKYYINMAGGFDNRAKRSGTYIVYANGDVARTKKFLFLNFYPTVKPGSDIIVPAKPLKIPIRVQDVVAITSGLATLALLINQISNNNP